MKLHQLDLPNTNGHVLYVMVWMQKGKESWLTLLKKIAPVLGFSGYQPLMRTYIGQGLRKDLEKLENSPFWELIESLKRHGVEQDIINNALNEITSPSSD